MNLNVTRDRDKYIGASDLPTILGYNKSFGTTIIQFAKEKLKLVKPTFNGNQYTRYGQLMEPLIRKFINESFGFNFVEDTIIDEERKLRGNCDGIDREKGKLLEIKTFSNKLKVDYYTPQCQMYMELFDINECWLVGYDRPSDFYTGVDYTLEKDDSFFNTEFDDSRICIYKLLRNKQQWNKIECEIDKFKYLLECLKEEAILNDRGDKNDSCNDR